jgi:putative acetyltransferase
VDHASFHLEPKDIETLNNPEGTILHHGGEIYLAYAGAEPVGCVALIPMGEGVYELSKMAVTPHLRGQGIGRRLLQYAIARARHIGANSLFLGSSTKLPSAVRLYEAVGFEHVPPESLPNLPYTRANVFMKMRL